MVACRSFLVTEGFLEVDHLADGFKGGDYLFVGVSHFLGNISLVSLNERKGTGAE